MTRKAGHTEARRWQGDNAVANELDEVRSFVVWGDGYLAPEGLTEAREGTDIAEGIARTADERWGALSAEQRWCAIVVADEDEIDALVQDGLATGYAPYLVDGKNEEIPPDGGIMRPTLRSDVAPRRKVDQPRPD